MKGIFVKNFNKHFLTILIKGKKLFKQKIFIYIASTFLIFNFLFIKYEIKRQLLKK